MITADEARKRTKIVIDNFSTTEMQGIESEINKAINEGYFSISRDGCLARQTIKRLEELGYKVATGTQYNESYYTISWK